MNFELENYPTSIEHYQYALEQAVNLSNPNAELTILRGLSQAHLATEDTQNFLSLKQKTNILLSEVGVDKSNAINWVYNFISSQEKDHSTLQIRNATENLYSSLFILLIIVVLGMSAFFIYHSKTKEYEALSKYLLHRPKEEIKIEKKPNVGKSTVPEETEQMILAKLQEFEAGTKFTNPNMSIALLASEFNTNTKYLSEVINKHKGKNINGYVNELRINYIINKLKTDSVYFNYKISYLAEECGFSSHSSFATVFKNVTGVSPTKFMDFLQKRDKSV